MHRITITSVLAFTIFLLPLGATAHETHRFIIGDTTYQFVIGSMNEPIAVDDRTGVYLSVTEMQDSHGAVADHHSTEGGVLGLEETLHVELMAGSERRTLEFVPAYGEPGAYQAPFIPTVATSIIYRVFGEINATPVDLRFTCTPAGHDAAAEDTTEVQVSEGVTRTLKRGSYGCPTDKVMLGFPEESASVVTLENGINSSRSYALAAFTLSVVALGLGFVRRRT